MIKSNENNTTFWCVTRICGDNKNLSSALIHPNSIRLLYVSDSFASCLRMTFQKIPQCLGGQRPILDSNTTIQKVSIDTIMRLFTHESELSADNYDDDYDSTFRARYAGSLKAIWIVMLMGCKDIDFRKPDAGIHASEVRKCIR